jgi:hypothetical protein
MRALPDRPAGRIEWLDCLEQRARCRGGTGLEVKKGRRFRKTRQQAKGRLENRKTIATRRNDAWFGLLALLGIIHGGLLWLDHRPMFFLGDSASYIWTAVSGWKPPDRSFVYGYFIRLVALSTQSLLSLVIVQVVLLAAASVVMAHLLIRYFRVRPWIACGAALLTAVEPLQLLFVRYVMTETLALFLFVFYLWVVLHYLECPRIKWLMVMQFFATLMISVRFAFLPMGWVLAFGVPALGAVAMKGRGNSAGLWVVHVLMSILLLFVFTSAYKHLHGYVQRKPPAYSYESGFFLMSFMLPIIEASDFADSALGGLVLKDPIFPIADRQARGAHRWMVGGAVWRLKKLMGKRAVDQADAIAGKAAFHAVVHRPLAFLGLGWHTFADYFSGPCLRPCMEYDLGNQRLQDSFHALLKARFHYPSDPSSPLELKTITGRYFLGSGNWIRLLLFAPVGWVFLSLFAKDADSRRKHVTIALVSAMLAGVAVFLVERPTPRYLHTVAWLFCLMGAAGLDRLLRCCIPESSVPVHRSRTGGPADPQA